MLPWEGPPLPRFLGIFWPRLGGGEQEFLPLPASTPIYLTDVEEQTEKALVPSPRVLYENTEEIEWVRDKETGLTQKIIRRIKVTKNE